MRRLTALFLLAALILCGCSAKVKAPFYYCRSDFQTEPVESIIGSESRDITGHEYQLDFLISLYLLGPSNTDLVSPFPSNVQLQKTQVSGNSLTVFLTNMDNVSDSRFTVASACMALTCFNISHYETLTIVSGNRSLTLDPTMLTLYDSGAITETTTGGSL